MWKSELAPEAEVGKVGERSRPLARHGLATNDSPQPSRRLPGDFRARPMLETETHTQMMSLEDYYKDCAVSGGQG